MKTPLLLLAVVASPLSLAAQGFGFGFGPTAPTKNPSDVAPAITTQPVSGAVATGAAATLKVVATGSPAPTYQWSLNGWPIRGATSAAYTIASTALTQAGAYTVDVRNRAGDAHSNVVTLSVASKPIVTVAPKTQTINAGGAAALGVTATGAGLTYQWQFNGQTISGQTAATLPITNASVLDGGIYAVKVSDGAGPEAIEVAQLTVNVSARLTNLSVMGLVGAGEEELSVGFSISGTGNKSVLIRGIGPNLAAQKVSNPLAAPDLTLIGARNKTIAANTAWGGTTALVNAFTAAGAYALPPASKDTALLESLAAGGYTANLTGVSGATGTALAEIYDADSGTPTADLVNVSGIAYVGSSNVLTAGFVVKGTTSDTVLLRGIGPTLSRFGMKGTVSATTVALFTAAGAKVAEDTGWGNSPELVSCFGEVGAFMLPFFSKDSAFVATLAPGAYTAQVTGAAGATGLGMVEVYEVK